MTTPLLACGACLDQSLLAGVPFTLYWILLFFGWTLLAGIPLAIAAKIRDEPLPLHPHRYFLLALALVAVLGIIPLQGSFVVPTAVATVVALVKVTISQRRLRRIPPPAGLTQFAYRVQRVYLAASVAAVPVAFARLWCQGRQ